MSSRALVRRGNNNIAWGATAAQRRMIRNIAAMAWRNRRRIAQGARAARDAASRAREVIHNRNRRTATNSRNYAGTRRGRRKFYKVQGIANGTTHTTTRMLVRKTPRYQRFLRKLFKTNPLKKKYINRFGFAWMGADAASKTIWYSVCHLKFNNICKYMQERVVEPYQDTATTDAIAMANNRAGNLPDAYIYIGKCTFNYEIYNPTNYIVTVFIYDLICKHDTPHEIKYNAATNSTNSAPEACMCRGADPMENTHNVNAPWVVADPTTEKTNTYWNSIGTKPTDYHLFNTMWKIKGVKKIVLPPTSSHHHVVVYNPKKKITQASLFYPREHYTAVSKNGIAGITQATLFGFQGQVAVENNQASDNTSTIGTLPGKIIVNVVKKVNVWQGTLNAQIIQSETSLKTSWTKPTIFTDLVEQDATAT